MPHHHLNGSNSQQHQNHCILERLNKQLQDRISFLRFQFVEPVLRLLRFDGLFIETFFSAARFRVRGYDNENNVTYMNGVPMTDLNNGNSMFFLWGGLNDVTRNRESFTGLSASTFAFGEIGGGSYIDTRASKQRKQLSASFALSNQTHNNKTMVTYGTGLMKGGWAVAGSLSRR